MIDDAMDFATKAHEGQFRKGTRRPYIVHPIEVADIVSTMTKDEEVICAAVLHDTIEDCSGITWDILKLRFGGRVADMVAQESEDKSLSWEERKGATIKRLRTAPIEVQMIGLADKLSNMRDIDRDYPVLGDELWGRFRMQSKSALAWYYKGIRDALEENFKGVDAYEEYCRLIDKNFGLGPAHTEWRKGDGQHGGEDESDLFCK
ncbi:bifunctional (p)ppGpp synthetase/guanosine-3',5'-bis(diphosphate) 3'-pyrophosphohydrolase [Mediterraneibacter catenae]|uniref:Bifunctional (P)ppGpp synthetase/guanosine-3',5'-bis(Diphosphate) 3'-pyrophosphohydrolase n=1 Tax=Mediterraneibacter catenae TaxID=2594882 RepID=A0A5M9I1R7_9FIRM|nr:HD domain-containing protein [Mediterraneibacter catenae]KAA8501421.1 bifunctional (p)ppGpp synthetase/guanosine-3',5'-bis(diphosphate) 3'-pyrophosphohydrolase [Mediterraneibacter catenae]